MLVYPKPGLLTTPFDQPISEQIWRRKYQYVSGGVEADRSVRDTWLRVARSLSEPESADQRAQVESLFVNAMTGFKLLPAGRILAGAGTTRNVTLANTFVMRTIPDSVGGIMDTIKDAALTMQMAAASGSIFSTLRPRGTLVRGLDCPAAGPLAAMDICDSVCKMLVSGNGRGAMMAAVRIDHPAIEDFVAAKTNPLRLRNFNTSVMITDRFMQAVEENADWDLLWQGAPVRSVNARDLWEKIMWRTYSSAEPGVLFIDRINAANPLGYLEGLSATRIPAQNSRCRPMAPVRLPRSTSRGW